MRGLMIFYWILVLAGFVGAWWIAIAYTGWWALAIIPGISWLIVMIEKWRI